MTATAAPAESPSLVALTKSVQDFGRLVSQGRVLEMVLKGARIDLTRADVQLLHALLEVGQGIRFGDLADRLLVDAPTVTRRVQQLEARHLVRRTTDPLDRRAQLVQLTPAGTRLIERTLGLFNVWLEEVLAEWSVSERQQLAGLVARFTHDVSAALECHGH